MRLKQNKSKLTEKLTKKMMVIYTIIYLCLFVLLLSVLMPVLYHDTTQKKKEYTSLIYDQYKEILSVCQGDLNYLASIPSLSILLKDHLLNQDKKSAALIEQSLQSYSSCYERIKLIVIENDKGRILQTFSNSHSDALSCLQKEEGYQKLKKGIYSTYYSPVYSPDIWYTKKSSSVSVSQRYSIYNHSFIFTIFYDVDNYLRNSQLICDKDFTDYSVLTKDFNTCIYTTEQTLHNKILSGFSSDIISYSGQLKDLNGIYFYEKDPVSGWIIITFTSWMKLLSGLLLILFIIIIVYCISPVLFYLFLVPTNTKYLLPLSLLTEAVSNYCAGDELNISIQTNDEIELLNDMLHTMSLKINQQIKDIQEQEHKNCITQYSLLATQIDPHFIYNTLNIVNIFARQNKTENVIDINTALSRILRERLNIKTSIFETLQNELNTINDFCVIMKYRYTDHVKVNINIESEMLNEKVPKNILLPIVENSFYHGLSNENGIIAGTIDINIYSMDHEIIIEISDDGIGISEEVLLKLRSEHYRVENTDRSHIGLTNVYERLYYVYEELDKITQIVCGL
ncbi:MAG: histidine kinase, partial [Lachnospiraceae bacterium]